MSSTPHLSLTQALRQHTRDLHRTLDSTPGLRQLLDPDLTPSNYAESLLGLWLAHQRAEALLLPLDAGRPPELGPYQSRLGALQEDLLALGHDPTAMLHGHPPESRSISPSSLGHYLGMRYVVEGASQGARIIGSRLNKSLGMRGIRLAYWDHQAFLAEGWPALCRCLDAIDTPGIRSSALAGAEQTFHLFIAVFHESSRQPARHIR